MVLNILAGALLAAALIGVVLAGWLVLRAWRQARSYARLHDTHDLARRIDPLGEAYAGRRAAVCLSVGVSQRGRRHTSRYSRPDEPPGPPEPLYEIGSITHVFTGVLLARMVEENRVRLEETVAECLPEPPPMETEVAGITLGQLASHTSGLPRLPENFDALASDPTNPYAGYRAEHLYQALQHVKLLAPPGRRLSYSNLGFALLGHLLACRAGIPFEALLGEWVCQPLGLRDTVITLNPAQRQRMLPGRLPTGERVPEWEFDVLAPAGALRASLADLLDFIEANLHPPEGPLGRALQRAQQAQFRDWSGGRAGLGWLIREDLYTDLVILWHNGGTGGFCSFLGIAPAHGLGVVLLSNSGDAWADDHTLDDMGLEILTLASRISLSSTPA